MRKMLPKEIKEGQKFSNGKSLIEVTYVSKNFVRFWFDGLDYYDYSMEIIKEKDEFCSFLVNEGYILQEPIKKPSLWKRVLKWTK